MPRRADRASAAVNEVRSSRRTRASARQPGESEFVRRTRARAWLLAHFLLLLCSCCVLCVSAGGKGHADTDEVGSAKCQQDMRRQKRQKRQKDLHVSCVFLVSLLFWGSDYLPSVAVKHIADPLLGFCLKEKLVGCLGCGCAWLCCAVWCPGLGTSAGEAQQMGQLATGIAANRGKGGGKGGFCGLCGCGWGWGQTKPRTKSAEQQQAGSRDRRGPGSWQLAKIFLVPV